MEVFKMIFGAAIGILLIFAGRKIWLENAADDENIVMYIAGALVMLAGISFLGGVFELLFKV